jgi:hypothetical protein
MPRYLPALRCFSYKHRYFNTLPLRKRRVDPSAPSSRRDDTIVAAAHNKHYFLDCWGGADNQIHCQYLSPNEIQRCTSALGKAESKVVG